MWKDAKILDDRVTQSNKRGMITFATAGPNTRTTQLFINFGDNARLDADGFAPFGQVVEGMDVVDKINPEYMEKPDQGTITTARKGLSGSKISRDWTGLSPRRSCRRRLRRRSNRVRQDDRFRPQSSTQFGPSAPWRRPPPYT